MTKPNFSFSVISDVHIAKNNDNAQLKLENALNDINQINPSEDNVVIINGDLVTDGEYESYNKLENVLSKYQETNSFYYAIGNHEFFKADGNKESIKRFLDFAKRNSVYDFKEIKGYPFVFLGSESWGFRDPSEKDSAILSNEQLVWLENTLAEYKKTDSPVFAFIHQPMPNSVTGTDITYYQKSILESDKLMKILKENHDNLYLFSGHTHWDLRLPNMLVQEPIVMASTGCVHDTYGPDGKGHEEVVDRNGSQGLLVDVYEDKVRIRARDFYKKEWIKTFDYMIPLK